MQHDGLVIKIAYRFLPLLDRASDMEDLLQAGRLGVLLAQATYDAGKGAFTTWAAYYIRTEMESALNLKGRKRPDRFAVSLDRPIPGAEELTLLDTLPDRTDMEEQELAKGTDAYIQTVVHTCMDELPWEQRMAVQLCDLDGMNNEQAAAFLGIESGSKVRSLRGKGQWNLRRMQRMRLLAWECGIAPALAPISYRETADRRRAVFIYTLIFDGWGERRKRRGLSHLRLVVNSFIPRLLLCKQRHLISEGNSAQKARPVEKIEHSGHAVIEANSVHVTAFVPLVYHEHNTPSEQLESRYNRHHVAFTAKRGVCTE